MSTDPKTAYEAVVDELQATSPAVPGKTFGMPALKIGSKVFAGFAGDGMVFKLPDSARAEALALPGAHLFDPAGMSRPMKEWVVVPADHAARWPDLARIALRYVESAR
jgi:hypothetical protein